MAPDANPRSLTMQNHMENLSVFKILSFLTLGFRDTKASKYGSPLRTSEHSRPDAPVSKIWSPGRNLEEAIFSLLTKGIRDDSTPPKGHRVGTAPGRKSMASDAGPRSLTLQNHMENLSVFKDFQLFDHWLSRRESLQVWITVRGEWALRWDALVSKSGPLGGT